MLRHYFSGPATHAILGVMVPDGHFQIWMSQNYLILDFMNYLSNISTASGRAALNFRMTPFDDRFLA